MARSLWKGTSLCRSIRNYKKIPFIQISQLNINVNRYSNIMNMQYFYKRNMPITINMLNKEIYIYNGKTFLKKRIISQMINHKVGEFVMTRKIPLRS